MPSAGERADAVDEDQVEHDVERRCRRRRRRAGVRVSCSPRSTPVAASMTSSGVVPRKAIRRYVVAWSVTSAPAPKASTSGPVSATPSDGGGHADAGRRARARRCPGRARRAGRRRRDGGRRCGGAVGEEDAEPDGGLEHDGGDAEPGQLRRAEVADDGGVGEQEQRLGDQRQEGGEGQAQDLAVERVRHRSLRLVSVRGTNVPADPHGVSPQIPVDNVVDNCGRSASRYVD